MDSNFSESDENDSTMAEEISVIEGHDLFEHSASDDHREHGKK